MCNKVDKLKELIKSSNNIVFFGGAGVSTESGIPDFRSPDGLYNQKYKYPPEYMLSHECFVDNQSEFYKFYREKMNLLDAKPNVTHYALAKLEKLGKVSCVITQNIDGLHQKAGSKNVAELHGSIYRNYCLKCHKKYDASYVFESSDIPKCECGYVIKPDVVLYGEALKAATVRNVEVALDYCDLLIVGGTSLSVYPASLYVEEFKDKKLVIINRDKTDYDDKATLVINDSLGCVFTEIMKDYE